MAILQFAQLSDEQLVNRYQVEKDQAIFEELYHRYEHKVFAYCYKISGDREEALDLSSEVFIKVFEKLETLRQAVTFQAWLFRIARNKSINLSLKRQHQFYIPLEEAYDLAEMEADALTCEEKEARIVKMNDILQALPQETQALLLAKYSDGDSIETLMQRYHLSESAVKMRLARARHKACELLATA